MNCSVMQYIIIYIGRYQDNLHKAGSAQVDCTCKCNTGISNSWKIVINRNHNWWIFTFLFEEIKVFNFKQKCVNSFHEETMCLF